MSTVLVFNTVTSKLQTAHTYGGTCTHQKIAYVCWLRPLALALSPENISFVIQTAVPKKIHSVSRICWRHQESSTGDLSSSSFDWHSHEKNLSFHQDFPAANTSHNSVCRDATLPLFKGIPIFKNTRLNLKKNTIALSIT